MINSDLFSIYHSFQYLIAVQYLIGLINYSFAIINTNYWIDIPYQLKISEIVGCCESATKHVYYPIANFVKQIRVNDKNIFARAINLDAEFVLLYFYVYFYFTTIRHDKYSFRGRQCSCRMVLRSRLPRIPLAAAAVVKRRWKISLVFRRPSHMLLQFYARCNPGIAGG